MFIIDLIFFHISCTKEILHKAQPEIL